MTPPLLQRRAIALHCQGPRGADSGRPIRSGQWRITGGEAGPGSSRLLARLARLRRWQEPGGNAYIRDMRSIDHTRREFLLRLAKASAFVPPTLVTLDVAQAMGQGKGKGRGGQPSVPPGQAAPQTTPLQVTPQAQPQSAPMTAPGPEAPWQKPPPGSTPP